MLSRSIFTVALLTVACSNAPGASRIAPPSGAPGDESRPLASADEEPPGAARSKKDICVTLDYGHQRSNGDYFRRFADDAAALAYSRDFLRVSNMPEAKDVTHDARLERLLSQVFDGFRKVYPRETEGLDQPPRIVVVAADGVNAFAGFDERPQVNRAPWLVWVHSGIFSDPKPDLELQGLFAHELGHLILRDLLPETRAKIRTHYRVPGGDEHGVIGAIAEDDPAVREHVEELRVLGAMVGRDIVFGPLPFSAFGDNEYQSLLMTLMDLDEAASPEPSACTAGADGLRRLAAIHAANTSVHDFVLRLTPAQRDEVDRLVASTSGSLRRCYGKVERSLFELKVRERVASMTNGGAPAEQARAVLDRTLDPTTEEHHRAYAALMTNDVERAVDAASTPTIDRLFKVIDTLHRRIGELEADPSLPIDELRVFDMEEDADDAALRVLRAVDLDPLATGRFFANLMPSPSRCYRDVESGEVPAYGRFIDPHNGTCWRFFHGVQLAKALERCPKVPRQLAPSAGASPSASRADRRPSEWLESHARWLSDASHRSWRAAPRLGSPVSPPRSRFGLRR